VSNDWAFRSRREQATQTSTKRHKDLGALVRKMLFRGRLLGRARKLGKAPIAILALQPPLLRLLALAFVRVPGGD
jgi:hypothetical protein